MPDGDELEAEALDEHRAAQRDARRVEDEAEQARRRAAALDAAQHTDDTGA